jgi:hypothetical protein
MVFNFERPGHVCKDGKPQDVIDEDAQEYLAKRLTAPLQFVDYFNRLLQMQCERQG